MPVEFRRKPPKGLRKHFRAQPAKRIVWQDSRKSKELPEHPELGFVIGGQAGENARANVRIRLRKSLKGTHPDFVNLIMECNEAVFVFRHNEHREYKRVSAKSHPWAVFNNLLTAGRKGDIEAVKVLSRIYSKSLKSNNAQRMKKDSRDFWQGLEKGIKRAALQPQQFCDAVQKAFKIGFKPTDVLSSN